MAEDALFGDALVDVLRAVHLTGTVFFDVEASAPWAAEAPPAYRVGPAIMPGIDHVIEYHVVTSGECWATLLGDETPPVRLGAGDVVAFPQGDAHVLSSAPGLRAEPNLDIHRRPECSNTLPLVLDLDGGGAERAHIVCGFLGCDARPFNPLLGALPRLMHMKRGHSGEWLNRLLTFAALERAEKRAGGASMLAKIGEIMFFDLVRNYLPALADGEANWLAGFRDRHVGLALNLLHQAPNDAWTLERLAAEAGMSRSSLTERFTHYVGMPPMQYLTSWRMQLASGMLSNGDMSIAQIAVNVGYDSEAAFSRAFKRVVGLSPAIWRERRKTQG